MPDAYITGPDEVVFSSKTMNDAYDRIQIMGDGRIKTGDGTAAPAVSLIPAATASAYTQTYSTAARTVPAAVAAITGGESPTEAEHNALVADVLALKKVVNAIIDDLQARGIAG